MNNEKFEKLVSEIMREAKEDKEPVTREEAEEMARMELSAKSERHYEQSAEKKERKPKERKIDFDKKHIFDMFKTLLQGMELNDKITDLTEKTETELSFNYNGCNYSWKLVKHRIKK